MQSLGSGWLEWGSGPIPSVSGSRPLLFHLSQFYTSFSTPISPAYPHITILSSPLIPIPPPQHNNPLSPNHQILSESLISPYVKNKPYLWVGRESISARSVESLTVRYQEEVERKRGGGYLAHQSYLRLHAAFLTLCWVRITTKYKSRPPRSQSIPFIDSQCSHPLCPSSVEEHSTSVSICIFL